MTLKITITASDETPNHAAVVIHDGNAVVLKSGDTREFWVHAAKLDEDGNVVKAGTTLTIEDQEVSQPENPPAPNTESKE